jgi:hypothetical protein
VTVLAIEPKAGPAAVPAAYAKAAAAKLKRDRQSYEEFRRLDQQEFERWRSQQLTAAVTAAEKDLREWQEDITVLEPEAAEALATFRGAEDRHRDAVKAAAGKRTDYERIRGKGTVGEEADAAVRADAADNVAADAAEVVEQKRAELADVDQNLAETRQGLAEAERTLDKARKAAQVPAGTAAISNATISANAAWMMSDEVWDTLTVTDKRRVQRAAQPRDIMTTQEFWAMMRQASATGGGAA